MIFTNINTFPEYLDDVKTEEIVHEIAVSLNQNDMLDGYVRIQGLLFEVTGLFTYLMSRWTPEISKVAVDVYNFYAKE